MVIGRRCVRCSHVRFLCSSPGRVTLFLQRVSVSGFRLLFPSLCLFPFLVFQDIPFIFAFLRAHSFPSEADFLGPSNPSGVSSGFSLRGAFRGVLFTDGAVGASEGSLNQQARQWRREGAGVALVLYLIAKLHSVPYFKGNAPSCLLLCRCSQDILRTTRLGACVPGCVTVARVPLPSLANFRVYARAGGNGEPQ